MSNNEVWVVFRGKLVREGTNLTQATDLDNLEEIVEVVRAEKISKTFIKLKESPMWLPNVAYGDILRVKNCEELSDRVAIIEFSGIELDTDNDDRPEGVGTDSLDFSYEAMKNIVSHDSKIRPIVYDKFKEGLVYEPIDMISHGSYKINISFEANSPADIQKMKNHFKNHCAHFQYSWSKNFGTVAFGLDTKFKNAVECLESAPCVSDCFIAFSPNEFPSIGFRQDLIPGHEQD
jgi:hypothetical protein